MPGVTGQHKMDCFVLFIFCLTDSLSFSSLSILRLVFFFLFFFSVLLFFLALFYFV